MRCIQPFERFSIRRSGIVGALAVLASCATGPGVDLTQVSFAPELGIDLSRMTRAPQGFYLADRVEGVGEEVRLNSRVTMQYLGWHPDGTLFESSAAEGGPVEFTVGDGRVIRGWDLGIRGMKAGGRRILVIPPGLAYGSRGIPGVIPGNATLVFEVQLVAVNR
ncbi:MAG: FKBP-type peptidyl-prolyl cis-trans isomerase [Gemmatimonadota bacterium]|jgi:FKBP-type peptidyl-prolyl cis-trans isomerase